MPQKDGSPLSNLVLLSQLGISMILPIIGGVLLGNYLDKKFSGNNLFLIIFVTLGALSALRNLYVIGTRLGRKDGEQKDDKKG